MRSGEDIETALPSRPLGREDIDEFEQRDGVQRVAAVGLEPADADPQPESGLAIALQVELATNQVYFVELDDGDWTATGHDGPNLWHLPERREERVESREHSGG